VSGYEAGGPGETEYDAGGGPGLVTIGAVAEGYGDVGKPGVFE
jgi:hypothetical protein